jgi:hypothetical protein
MVAEVCNKGVCPVRVFCPLNVGRTFDFGSIKLSVDVVLWLGATFPWHGGSQDEKLSRPKEGC